MMKKIDKNQPSFPPLFRGKALPLKKALFMAIEEAKKILILD